MPTSVRSRPYANIQQLTTHLTIRPLSSGLRIDKRMLLVGDDQDSGGKLSQPGGEMEKNENNPLFVGVREFGDECGRHLFVVLTHEIPHINYTSFTGMREALEKDDIRHPSNPDYSGHPVTLRFNFEMIEITGLPPLECEPDELKNPRFARINPDFTENKRHCFNQVLKQIDLDWQNPYHIEHKKPDFPAINRLLVEERNVKPEDAYTWSNHDGTLPYQEAQPYDELLRKLAEQENAPHVF